MAVTALYFSDRDGLEMAVKNPETMIFANKADADARDKLLELSEEIRDFLVRQVPGMDEDVADKCALAISEHRDVFQKAMKKPSLLAEISASPAEPAASPAKPARKAPGRKTKA